MECSEANVKKVKKCLMKKIKLEESILECATVDLSICSPQTGRIFRSLGKEGILCVIVDRNKSCLYLKLYDLIEFKMVFAIELYTNIADGYTVVDNHFHTIEFPGFFLGLSFPILNNPNVANRSSLIQKTIISTSKFISIKLSEYIYLHKFDCNKKLGKKGIRIRVGSDPNLSFSKGSKNIKINNIAENNDKISNESKDNNSINKIDHENNIDQNNSKEINNKDNENNNKADNVSEGQEHKNNEKIKENNNEINNNNLDENKINNSNNIPNEEENNIKIMENKKPETEEEKERRDFDSIIIEESWDKKIYKIVQYHFIRERGKVVKKLYKKNFNRFIDITKISYDNIKDYKINTYDFLNDVLSSSDEGEEQKTFIDYVPSKDMIGDLENEDSNDADERMKELKEKKNNLKEIIEKKRNEKDVVKVKNMDDWN